MGITIAGVLLVVGATLLIVFLVRRRKHKNELPIEMSPEVDPPLRPNAFYGVTSQVFSSCLFDTYL